MEEFTVRMRNESNDVGAVLSIAQMVRLHKFLNPITLNLQYKHTFFSSDGMVEETQQTHRNSNKITGFTAATSTVGSASNSRGQSTDLCVCTTS